MTKSEAVFTLPDFVDFRGDLPLWVRDGESSSEEMTPRSLILLSTNCCTVLWRLRRLGVTFCNSSSPVESASSSLLDVVFATVARDFCCGVEMEG